MRCCIKTTLACIALLTMFFANVAAARVNFPPPQLTSIFMDISEFETAFKSDKWQEARGAANKITSQFNQMLPQLKKDIKSDSEKAFITITTKLNMAVEKRETAETEKYFVELHTFLLSLISNYEYKVPPVFSLINRYIGEAEEALVRRRYKRVLSELDEIASLFSFAESHLADRDVKRKNIEEIYAKLRSAMAAARSKKSDVVKSEIGSVKKLLPALTAAP